MCKQVISKHGISVRKNTSLCSLGIAEKACTIHTTFKAEQSLTALNFGNIYNYLYIFLIWLN